MVLILELSRPHNRVISSLYNIYLKQIIPALGRIISGNQSEYAYLQESIRHVPQAEEMLEILTQAGFINGCVQKYTFGICSCYTAEAG
jgi:demethylmenaquinone methyltransferase/2-methoxy-6-polyprenyl-1,4-benzoquinol methylase